MNPTIQCMKLDFMLLKPYGKSIVLVLLVPLIFPFVTNTLFEGLSFAVTIMAMTTAYTFSIAEKNSLERFYGFLPIKRSSLVGGRYLTIFGMAFLLILLEGAVQVMILTFVQSTVLQVSEIIGSILVCALLFCIYAGVQIPGYYQYGAIKGKIFIFIPTVGFLIFYYVSRLLTSSTANQSLHVFSNTAILIACALALMLLIIAISVTASIRIVNKAKA